MAKLINMSREDSKLAVLRLLQQQSQAISLAELMQLLGPNYHARTVRRWLAQMVADRQVQRTGSRRNTRYKSLSASPTLFSVDSEAAVAQVRQAIFARDPVAYRVSWLHDYQPNQTYYLSAEQRQTFYAHGQRANAQDAAGTFVHKIYQRLLIDLSYNSSRLEGNTYSLLDTEKLLLEGVAAKGKLDAEKIMILNHKEAIDHLIRGAAKIKVSANEICTLHYLLADGLVPVQYAGKIPDHAVRISASTYMPLEGGTQLADQLQIICHKAAEIMDPFEQSFFLLAHLSYLQAFVDVNKRTARLSANIPFIQQNLVPLSFNDINKEDYMTAMLAIYELNDPRPLVDVYSFSYRRACLAYDASIEAVGYDAVRVSYRQERRDIIRAVIENQLVGEALDQYIEAESAQRIPVQDRQQFKQNVVEDLQHMSVARSAGIGITAEQLDAWLRAAKRK